MGKEANSELVRFWTIIVPYFGVLLHRTVPTSESGFEMCVTLKENVKQLSNQGLFAIPSNLPNQTEYLDVSFNNITSIKKGPLTNLMNLCFLKAAHCYLEFIYPDAFVHLKKLKVLNVSSNHLKAIPLINAHSLRILDLSRNEYNSYTLPNVFSNFTDLQTLSLGSKKAVSLKSNDLHSLRDIHLQNVLLGEGASLEKYENGALAHLTNLRELTLHFSFCQHLAYFDIILFDLNQTKIEWMTLVEFVPDNCAITDDPFKALKHMHHLKNLTITNTWTNSSFMLKLLKNIWSSSIEDLTFINIVYNEDTSSGLQFPDPNVTANLKSITFDGIKHYQYNYPTIKISTEHATKLSNIKFSGTGMNILPCDLMSAIPSLQTLDLSSNLLDESGFWWPLCRPTRIFPSLTSLSLSHNRFLDLALISRHSSQITPLKSLDLSFNSIRLTGSCSWSPNLTDLNLSNNNLGNDVFKFLSPHMKKLDLSKTGITTISQKVLSDLTSLTHLVLGANNIQSIPLNLHAPNLLALHLDQNAITYISEGVLAGLPKLQTLIAGRNPFSCTCDSYWFVMTMNKSLLPDWPLDYTCATPPSYSERSLIGFKPGYLSCHPWLQATVSLSVVIILTIIFSITFYICDGMWYTKMLWVWIRVKRRACRSEDRLLRNSFSYHAFISYSQHDSHWVDTKLVPTLEGAGLSLCIHERDFVPGQWIVDNIINCVEESYRTIFVLSRNFVQSDWCNYELFFAQHRAMAVDQDSVVFILLEPIPCDSLPKKYLKLRTLLRQQTYLEWPQDDCKKQVFWRSLKSMLQTGNKGVSVLKDIATHVQDTCSVLANEV